MDQKRILRLGALCLLFSLIVRLAGLGAFQTTLQAVCTPQTLSFILYTQTGRTLRIAAPETQPEPEPEPDNSITPTETTQPPQEQETQPEEAVISFSQEDLELISVYCYCDYDPDLESLLTQSVSIDLSGEAPTVLILHTHGSESYADTADSYRSLDESRNMLAVGDAVAQALTDAGISVIHDRTLYDHPDYNSAYSAARKAIQSYLEEYPTVQMVLDIHRDASSGSGGQLVTKATVNGENSAQLMFVIGTDGNGLYHPNWQENLALALKLNVILEQKYPGITRPINLRNQRYNEDLTAGSLLIEVGAAGNTLEEALLAAQALAEAIVALFAPDGS